MPVDNRYIGVGYGPPFETPSDNDFMAAHIESLEQTNYALHAEVERLKQNNIDWAERCMNFRKNDHDEYEKDLNILRADLTAAVEVLRDYVDRYDSGSFMDICHYYYRIKTLLERLEVK